MNLIRIGNRIINPNLILAASYDPTALHPATHETWAECIVSFGCDDMEIFYNEEAEQVWSFLCDALDCRNITPVTPELVP